MSRLTTALTNFKMLSLEVYNDGRQAQSMLASRTSIIDWNKKNCLLFKQSSMLKEGLISWHPKKSRYVWKTMQLATWQTICQLKSFYLHLFASVFRDTFFGSVLLALVAFVALRISMSVNTISSFLLVRKLQTSSNRHLKRCIRCQSCVKTILFRNSTTARNCKKGDLAQLVERVLSMHEVWRSIRQFSIHFFDVTFVSTRCTIIHNEVTWGLFLTWHLVQVLTARIPIWEWEEEVDGMF